VAQVDVDGASARYSDIWNVMRLVGQVVSLHDGWKIDEAELGD
jgi:hypothetical protein